MFRVEIKKDGLITNAARFENHDLANQWIEENHSYFPEDYTHEIIDMSDEIIFQEDTVEGVNNQKIGCHAVGLVYAINKQKKRQGIITSEQIISFLNDPIYQKVERFLKNGSLDYAVSMINNLPETYFSTENKQLILNYIEKNK